MTGRLLFFLLLPSLTVAAKLTPETLKVWEEYVATAQANQEQHPGSGGTFLWVDEAPVRAARVRSGKILIAPGKSHNPRKAPEGLIHDWVGAAFIPDASLRDVLKVARDYARYTSYYQPNVIESKALACDDREDRFFLRLVNKSFFVKTALDTEYAARYIRSTSGRGTASRGRPTGRTSLPVRWASGSTSNSTSRIGRRSRTTKRTSVNGPRKPELRWIRCTRPSIGKAARWLSVKTSPTSRTINSTYFPNPNGKNKKRISF